MAQTGIYWSDASSHELVGLNVHWDDIGAGTTASTVYVDFYAQSVAWGFADNQTINFGGSIGGAWNFTMSTPSGSTTAVFLGTYTVGSYSTSYGGGPSFTFSTSITGNYVGTGPSLSIGWTMPARPASAPNAPGTPAATSITTSSSYLSWSASGTNGTAVTAYQLQVATDSGFTSVVSETNTNDTGRTIGSLSTYTTYYVRVRSNSAVGYSGWSTTYSFMTAAAVPDAPTNLHETSLAYSSVNMAWVASVTHGAAVTAYQLQISTVSNFASITSDTEANDLSRTVGSLSHTTTYYARTRANSSVGYSGWSTTDTFVTLATVPGAPTSAAAATITQGTASISWVTPADNGGSSITQYHIQQAENSGFTTNLTDLYTASLSYALSSLMPLRGYYIRVAATNAIGSGAWSTTLSFTTLAGAQVKVSGVWQPAKVWVKTSGTWQETKVWKNISGTWKR